MVDVTLIRHASTSWSGVRYCGISDPPLSPTGLAEARRLAASLARDLPADCRIVSSPSRRALATASAIAEATRAPGVHIDPRWREADVGIAEGRTFDELTEIAPEIASSIASGVLAIDWPGGEMHASLAGRVSDALADLLGDGRPAAVVTHAGPFMHAVSLAEGRAPSTDDLVAPAAVRRISVVEGSVRSSVLRSTA
jgi:broad specificity phosphatase PhoE